MPSTTATDQPRPFLTLDEVAAMLSCTRQFLETRIADGEIAVFRPSARMIRIRRTELERWIASFTHGANAQP
jgi:excisionase family DNA binding protein